MATITTAIDPRFQLNPDGTAADPAAFRAALRADAEKMAALDGDEALKAVLLEGEVAEMQELLQKAYRVS